MSRMCATQLKALSMSIARSEGLMAGVLWVLAILAHSYASVRLIISASIKDRCGREPNCSMVMAPVVRAACASRAARIFLKVCPKHDSNEIGHRFVESVLSVRPGLWIGVHFASFHASGKTPWKSRLVNRDGSSSGSARCIAATIRYNTMLFPVAESSLLVTLPVFVSFVLTVSNVFLRSLREGG